MRVAIAVCVRDEGPFLIEWVAYHRVIGVTDFIFYSNDCVDGTDTLLDHLADRGLAQHFNNPAKGGKYQIAALRDARTKPAFEDADWKLVIDADEFLNVRVGDGRIEDLIAATGADVISAPMAMMANNGVRGFVDEPIIGQFTMRNDQSNWCGEPNIAVKTLTRGGLDMGRMGAHRPFLTEDALSGVKWVDGSGRPVPDDFLNAKKGARLRLPTAGAHELCTLNHYALRSLDSFLVKQARGDVNSPNRSFDAAYWRARDAAEVDDRSILRMRSRMDDEIARLMADPRTKALHDQCVTHHREAVQRLRKQEGYQTLVRELGMTG
ncbi:MAG: glycosyltransferase family 2 protein [Pseudomonadota bacterium]